MATTKRSSERMKRLAEMAARPQASVAAHRVLNMRPRVLAVAVSAALVPWTFLSPVLAQTSANALPTGGQVTSGSATLTYSSNKLQIDQGTNKAILQWDGFSIGSNAWVNFTQPSASSVALNRVTGTNPSEIFGRLTANGQVFLSNPNGVLFAPGASVDVGALFATTLSIADRDFLAGRYNFYNAGGAGSVVNQGVITATGYAALAGPQVRNDGIIVARAGTVALAAGERVALDMVGDGLIKVSVDQAAMNASAINTGRIEADGGNVVLTARSANALLDTVVNNTGIIRAKSLVERNGEIVLDGGSAGVVANSGTLTVAGTDAGATGGTVKVLGDKVALFSGTRIDASGDAGGGSVNVGGNYQGQGPLQNASQTIVARDAAIKADAITRGDGGSVVVWSNEATQFYGSISVRGGAESGNGGSVEVSGKHWLNYKGTTDARALNGKTGMLLLDPDDLTIVHDDGVATDSNNSAGPGFVANPSTTNPWQLLDSTINASLNTTDVTVTTSSGGSIQIRDDSGTVVIGAANARTLTMTSATGISWNAGWEYANNGQLTLNAQAGNIVGTGDLLISGTSPVLLQATTGINASLSGVTSIAAASSSGDVTLMVGSTSLSVDALTNPVSSTVVNGISAGGNTAVTYTGAGTLTLNQNISGTNATVVTDDLAFAGGQIVATNKAAVAPATAVTTISLGQGTNDGVVFGLNAFTVNGNIVASALQIGNSSNTGGITMQGTFDPSGVGSTLKLVTSGTIKDPGGAETIGGTNIDALALVGGAGIGTNANHIKTQVGSLAASSSGAGIFLDDAKGGSVNVTTVDGVVGITSNNGDIHLTQTNDLTVSQAINAGAGNLDITFGNTANVFTLAATGSLTSANTTIHTGGGADTFDFSAAPATTATLTGGNGNDTLKQSGQTWDLTGLNAGNSGGLSWTQIGNLVDTGAGVFRFTTNTAGVQHQITAVNGTLDYSAGRTNPVTFDVANGNNATSGIGETWSGITTVTGNGTGSITNMGAAAFDVTGTMQGTSAGISYSGFTAADTTTVTGASGFNDGTKTGSGITFALSNNVTGTGTISNVTGSFDDATLVSAASGVDYAGFTAVTGTGTALTGVNVSFNDTTKVSGSGVNYGGFGVTGVSGSGTVVTGVGTSFNDTTKASASGINYSGLGGLAAVAGDGTANLTGTANFNITGAAAGTAASGINYSQFNSVSSATTVTGANGFNDATRSGSGITFASAASVTGTGTISGVAGAFNDATQISAASGIDYGGFTAVSGGGTTLNGVVGSFDDTSKISAATGINYSGYTINAVNGTGGSVTGVAGTFDLPSKVSGSGIGYSGFGVTAVAGNNATATITGSGLTYALANGTPNAGSASGVSWTQFPNIVDATGALNMQSSGSVTGNVTAQSVNYGAYGSPVSFSLSGAAGTSTGIGGTRSGVTTVTGSPNSDTITGGAVTYNLTGVNVGSSSGLSWTSFENISANGGATFQLSVGSGNVSGTLSSTGSATLDSPIDITALNVSVPATLLMTSTTGSATTWRLSGASQPNLFQTTSPDANVYFNGACVGGPACGTVIAVTASIGASVSQIAAQALKDAQSTDSVAKQIDYGFAGDVGTTPPMDHRIDETGISTPACFDESREGTACK